MKKLIPAVIAFLSPCFAEAGSGGWVISGGELFEFDHNAWFLSSHGTLKYCIQTGPDISQTKEELDVHVQRALQYWKKELNQVRKPHSGAKDVGGNSFELQPACSENVDLSLQFGFLSPEQLTFFGDPTRFVGASVRTSYDVKSLRGQGFIYISPDHGPLAMRKRGVLPKAWDAGDGALLEKAIAHELGHVFGLQHQGDGFEIMAETFLETMTSTRHAPLFFDLGKFPDFTKYSRGPWWSLYRQDHACDMENPNSTARIFFSLAPEDTCIRFRVIEKDTVERVEVQSRRDGEFKTVGSLFPQMASHEVPYIGTLRIPFLDDVDVVPTVGLARTTYTGFYSRFDSAPRKQFVMLIAPNRLQIHGVLTQSIEIVVDASVRRNQ